MKQISYQTWLSQYSTSTKTSQTPKQRTMHTKTLSQQIYPNSIDIRLRTMHEQRSPNQTPKILFLQKKQQRQRRKIIDSPKLQSPTPIQIKEEPIPRPLTPELQIKQEIIEPLPPPPQEQPQQIEQEHNSERTITSVESAKNIQLTAKNKFRQVVQQQSKLMEKRKSKSLFNLLISADFNIAHQEERKSISDKLEEGNQILAKQQLHLLKNYFNDEPIIKQYEFDQNWFTKEQDDNHEQIQSTTLTIAKKDEFNTFNLEIKQKIRFSQFTFQTQNSQISESSIPVINKFKITVSYADQDKIFEFDRPKHLTAEYQQQSLTKIEIMKIQSTKKITTPQFLENPIEAQRKSFVMQKQSSSKSIMQKQSKSGDAESPHNAHNILLCQEYSKASLFARIYYQQKFHKIQKKSQFSPENLIEAQDDTLQQTQLVTLDSFLMIEHKINYFEKIYDKLIKWISMKLNVSEVDDDNQIETLTDQRLEDILENRNSIFNSIQLIKIRLGRVSKQVKDKLVEGIPQDSSIWTNDNELENKQLSMQNLLPIKSIKKQYLLPIDLQPIVSALDDDTRNFLITQVKFEDDSLDISIEDDSRPIIKLYRYYGNVHVRKMISKQITLRYEDILVGSYSDVSKFIDFEHDQVLQEEITLDTLPPPPTNRVDSDLKMKLSSQIGTKTQSQQKQQQPKQQNQSMKNLYKSNSKQSSHISQSQEPINSPPQKLNSQSSQTNHLQTLNSTQFLTNPQKTNQSESRGSSVDIRRQDSKSSQQSSQKSIKSKSGNLSPKTTNDNIVTQSQQPVSPKVVKTEPPPENHQVVEQSFQLTMNKYSLLMRTHIREHRRRQQFDQATLIKLAIEDNNLHEFLDQMSTLTSNINTRVDNGNTFLMLASWAGNKEIVKDLLLRNADINLQNNDGNTALHLALFYGNSSVADVLIEAGANHGILNNFGKSAWSFI
ncbi:hypothetical protein pb186bvf_018192 [Paramecium bursaria]